jgi:hypothetical protein
MYLCLTYPIYIRAVLADICSWLSKVWRNGEVADGSEHRGRTGCSIGSGAACLSIRLLHNGRRDGKAPVYATTKNALWLRSVYQADHNCTEATRWGSSLVCVPAWFLRRGHWHCPALTPSIRSSGLHFRLTGQVTALELFCARGRQELETGCQREQRVRNRKSNTMIQFRDKTIQSQTLCALPYVCLNYFSNTFQRTNNVFLS